MSSRTDQPKPRNADLGTLAEKIVARLHAVHSIRGNVTVEHDVALPAIEDDTRTRQADVVITATTGASTNKWVIEVKNWGSVVDVKQIDEFYGMLDDVGIPADHGIFVSVNGFTSGARSRAKKVGITLLQLVGLNAERTGSRQIPASHAQVWLLMHLRDVFLYSDDMPIEASGVWPIQFREEGAAEGESLPLEQILLNTWLNMPTPIMEGPKPLLGTMRLEHIGRYHVVDSAGKSIPDLVTKVQMRVSVEGHALTVRGSGESFLLIDPETYVPRNWSTFARVDADNANVKYDVLRTTEEMNNFIERSEGDQGYATSTMVGKFHRIRSLIGVYWPLSARVKSEIAELNASFDAGRISDVPDDLSYLEAPPMFGIWEVPEEAAGTQ